MHMCLREKNEIQKKKKEDASGWRGRNESVYKSYNWKKSIIIFSVQSIANISYKLMASKYGRSILDLQE